MEKLKISFDNEPKNLRKTLNTLYQGMIGKNLKFNTPFGRKPSIYADFTASGRAYAPLENVIKCDILPYYSNIHSTGVYLPDQIQKYRNVSKDAIRKVVHADPQKDRVIITGQGTTSAINKLVSILKLKEYTQFYLDLIKLKKLYNIFLERKEEDSSLFETISDILHIKTSFTKLFPKNRMPFQSIVDITKMYNPQDSHFIYDLIKDVDYFKPIIFYSYMEHNSNYLPWLHDGVHMIQIKDHLDLEHHIKSYNNHYIKIGSFSAASNVTGRLSDVDQLAIIMHVHGGVAFFDYATGAPYLRMEMNSMLPHDYRKKLGFLSEIKEEDKKYCYKDGLFFSPHKFLGGNNTPGVLVCKERVIHNLESSPSQPGGGTVLFVTKNQVHYSPDIETREEGGTPDIIGSIRIGLALNIRNLVDDIDLVVIDQLINTYVTKHLKQIKNLRFVHDFDDDTPHLPIYSLLITYGNKYFHYNYITCLLNDLFGIQTRPGCSCAPLYGQILLFGEKETEAKTNLLKQLEYYAINKQSIYKPGFTRLNFPYFYPKFIIDYILYAIQFVALHAHEFLPLYKFNIETGVYTICDQFRQKQHHSLYPFFSYNRNNFEYSLMSLQKEIDTAKSSANKLLSKLSTYIQTNKTVQENMRNQHSLMNIKLENNYQWFLICDDIDNLKDINLKRNNIKNNEYGKYLKKKYSKYFS